MSDRKQFDEDKKGPYVPPDQISFWYPVTFKLESKIQALRNEYRRRGQRPPGPYQIISDAVEAYRLSGDVNMRGETGKSDRINHSDPDFDEEIKDALRG